MGKLSELLENTNDNIVKGWAFRTEDNGESFKLLELDVIETEDGTEDAWVATIHDMSSFLRFVEEQSIPPSKKVQK